MIGEEKSIKLIMDDGNLIDGFLVLYEEVSTEEDVILIELFIHRKKTSYRDETFFGALQALRQYLENQGIQILCNGAALNVYPSPMQLSMGSGRLAYKLELGKPATSKDIVDIFEYDKSLKIVGIDEQFKYYDKWINSLI